MKQNFTTNKFAKTLGASKNATTDVHNQNDKTNARVIQSGSGPAGHLEVIQPEMNNKLSFSSASYDYDNKVIMVAKLAAD